MYSCVNIRVSILALSKIFIFDVGIVPTLYLFSILFLCILFKTIRCLFDNYHILSFSNIRLSQIS
jgi:hypothetical protein